MPKFFDERDGQMTFFANFGIPPETALVHNTDGLIPGTLFEFKLTISNIAAVLFQAVRYCSALRIKGVDVPAQIILVDLNADRAYVFRTADYDTAVHQQYNTPASKNVEGFSIVNPPLVIDDVTTVGAQEMLDTLDQVEVHPIHIDATSVIAWSERFYRETNTNDKALLLRADPSKGPLGELKNPIHFEGKIHPYPHGLCQGLWTGPR